MAKQLRQ